ncbi:hypothetical protein SUDANB95_05485 [Actinosynnema sp. ALI-1.44]
MTEDAGLFDVPPTPSALAAPPTPNARRRERQALAVRHRAHPLTVALGYTIPLHPDATAPDGPRCGGCRFRVARGGTAKDYPKCIAGGPGRPRVTHGPGTDVLASWPACTDYEPATTTDRGQRR